MSILNPQIRNGITMVFLNQLGFTSGAREGFDLPQSTWTPHIKQKCVPLARRRWNMGMTAR
jgi:hypothetical protein